MGTNHTCLHQPLTEHTQKSFASRHKNAVKKKQENEREVIAKLFALQAIATRRGQCSAT